MLFAQVVVIKRNGSDGASFPLTQTACLFGRSNECDIRIQLPQVGLEHCRLEVNENREIFLVNLDNSHSVEVNKKGIKNTVQLKHKDVFTIIDRSFRLEIPSAAKSPKSTAKKSISPFKSKTPRKPMSLDKSSTPQNLKSVKNAMILTPKLKPPTVSNSCPSSSKKRVQSPSPTRSPLATQYQSRGRSPKSVNNTPVSSMKKTPIKKALTPRAGSTPNSNKNTPNSVRRRALSTPVGPQSAKATNVWRESPKSPKITQARESNKNSSFPEVHSPKSAPQKSFAPRIVRPAPATPRVAGPKPATPRVASPKPATPRVASPKPATPRVANPKPATPRTASPRQAASRAASPRQATPRVASPKPVTSRVASPKPATPRVSSPKPATPRVSSPEPATPRVASPKPATPRVSSPKPVTPRVSSPKPATPRVSSPKPATPRVSSPKPATPRVSSPKPATPRVSSPKPAAPRVSSPKPATPRVSSPKPATPRVSSPKPAAPRVSSPKPATPRVSSTKPAAPRVANPELATSKVSTPKATILFNVNNSSAAKKTPKSSGKKRKLDVLDSTVVPPSAKKKRVSFGPKLSPELFVKKLPPSTPVRRGAVPHRIIESPKNSSPLLKRKSLAAPKQSPIREELSKLNKPPAMSKSSEKSPAMSKPSVKSPSRSKSPAKSPARSMSPAMSKSPAKSPATSKSPARSESPARSMLPAKSPARSMSPAKSPTRSKSPAKSPALPKPPAKSPAKSPARSMSPAKSPTRSKSPAKSPALLKPPAKSPATSKSATKSPTRSKSPAKTSARSISPAKSPTRSKSPAKSPALLKPPAKSPATSKSAAKSPTRSKSPAKYSARSMSPAKSPTRSKSPAKSPALLKPPAKSPATSKPAAKSPTKSKSPAKSSAPSKLLAKSPPSKPPGKSPATAKPTAKLSARSKSPAKLLARSKSPAKSPLKKEPPVKLLTVESEFSKSSRKSMPASGKPSKKLVQRSRSVSSRQSIILSEEDMDRIPVPLMQFSSESSDQARSVSAEVCKSLTPKAVAKSVPKMVANKSSSHTKSSKRKSSKIVRNKNNHFSADLSFTGVADLLSSPIISTPASARSKARSTAVISPTVTAKTPTFSAKKTGPMADALPKKTPKGGLNLKRKRSSSGVVTNVKRMKIGTPKVTSPPAAVKNVIALRAIHGKVATPKLKSWADIVKRPHVAKMIPPAKPKQHISVKPPTPIPSVKVYPKTPRSKAAQLAPSTGHIESPITIVIGRKNKLIMTPKPLPKKGRKSIAKKARKSVGRVSFAGVKDLFQTPPPVSSSSRLDSSPSTGTPESVLYADIPDTPNGPGEMMVSPLSSTKLSAKKTRKSINLVGVKELFKITKDPDSPPKTSGIRRLMATPVMKQVPASPSGIAQLFASPAVEKSTQRKTDVKSSVNVKIPVQSSPEELQRALRRDGSKKMKAPTKTAVEKKQVLPVPSPEKVSIPVKERVSRRANKLSIAKTTSPKQTRRTRAASKVTTPKTLNIELLVPAVASPMKGRRGRRNAVVSTTKQVTPKPSRVRNTRSAPKEATPKPVMHKVTRSRSTRVASKPNAHAESVPVASPVKVPSPVKRGRANHGAVKPVAGNLSLPTKRSSRNHAKSSSYEKVAAKVKAAKSEPEVVEPVFKVAEAKQMKSKAVEEKANLVKTTTPLRKGRTTRRTHKAITATPKELPSPDVAKPVTPQPAYKGKKRKASPVKATTPVKRGRKKLIKMDPTSSKKAEEPTPVKPASPAKRTTRGKQTKKSSPLKKTTPVKLIKVKPAVEDAVDQPMSARKTRGRNMKNVVNPKRAATSNKITKNNTISPATQAGKKQKRSVTKVTTPLKRVTRARRKQNS